MQFQSIPNNRRRLADDVYEQIVTAAMRQALGPGDILVQEKLAADMQISRTPVREALMRLEHEGVLEASRRGSFRFRQMGPREIAELYQTRTAVEGEAARILAVRQDPFDMATLREVVASEEAVAAATPRSAFEADRNIHRALAERAGNALLLDLFDYVWARAVAARLTSEGEAEAADGPLEGHMLLVDAIASGDPDAAYRAVAAHLQTA